MKARFTTAVLAIGIFASSGVALGAQSITFSFGDPDRQAMRQWYRDHYNAPEFQGQQRWNDQAEQRLQVGIVLAPDLQAWARPAPQDLSGRLSPLPRGYRYVIVGDHLVVVDDRWLIHDVNHFERFEGPDQQVMRDWRDHRDAREFEGRQQGGITFTFGDPDRQAMREWFRNHPNAPEFQDQRRWSDRMEQRLQVGIVLAPDLRAWARPAPRDLYGRLGPLPRGYRYVIVGEHVVVVDDQWLIHDAYHFERFQDPDQQAMREWYPGHRDAPAFRGRQRWNDRFEQRIPVGSVLDPELRRWTRPVPPDLLSRLPPRRRFLRYVILGDHVLLIDNWWTVRDVFHFER